MKKQEKNHKKPIIQLEKVWKTYKMGPSKVHALREVSLEVMKGDFLAVLGPSGSGKSTFMNMIGCLDTPTSGNIYLSGKDIAKMSESQLARIRGKKIGFIFQQFNLLKTLTARENVMLPMMFQDIPLEERMKKSKEYLELVGLRDRMNHTPAELSGGQQQRVAIARSLANEPEVILADEPTGNLDSKSGNIVMDFLQKLRKEKGTTIVIVTHDEKLTEVADSRVYIKDGMLVNSLDEDTTKIIDKEV